MYSGIVDECGNVDRAEPLADGAMEDFECWASHEMDGEQIGDVSLLLWAATIDADVPNFVEDTPFDGDERPLEQVVRNTRVEERSKPLLAEVRLDGSTSVDHLPRGGADDGHALVEGCEILLIPTRDEMVSRQFGVRHAQKRVGPVCPWSRRSTASSRRWLRSSAFDAVRSSRSPTARIPGRGSGGAGTEMIRFSLSIVTLVVIRSDAARRTSAV